MIVEFKIIYDPLRPSISTNLCSVCHRNQNQQNKIGCCTYEPEFCLFDLVFLYLRYPDIYQAIMHKGQIIKGYNGIMIEVKSERHHCPFINEFGCVLPKDATTPLCRLYICREAALFGPANIEEKFDEYFISREYHLNQYLNDQLIYDKSLTNSKLHEFIVEFSPTISAMLAEIARTNSPAEVFSREIDVADFGVLL